MNIEIDRVAKKFFIFIFIMLGLLALVSIVRSSQKEWTIANHGVAIGICSNSISLATDDTVTNVTSSQVSTDYCSMEPDDRGIILSTIFCAIVMSTALAGLVLIASLWE